MNFVTHFQTRDVNLITCALSANLNMSSCDEYNLLRMSSDLVTTRSYLYSDKSLQIKTKHDKIITRVSDYVTYAN